MKIWILLPFLILVAISLLGCNTAPLQTGNVEAADSVPIERPSQITELPQSPPKYCPVTQPPEERFIPPDPYKEYPYPGQFYYGTATLWTTLPIDQVWKNLPYDPEQGFGQKLFFQREGYDWRDEPLPSLTISGRRIDLEPIGESIKMKATDATNGYTDSDKSFILVGGQFPTSGCWEITARYDGDDLTYVIWITS